MGSQAQQQGARDDFDDVLAAEIAQDVQPGEELGILIPAPDGRLADRVVSSCARVANPGARGRTVAMLCGRSCVEMYLTTHADSGHLMASVASRDVLIP